MPSFFPLSFRQGLMKQPYHLFTVYIMANLSWRLVSALYIVIFYLCDKLYKKQDVVTKLLEPRYMLARFWLYFLGVSD
jgi:hypothetical protein